MSLLPVVNINSISLELDVAELGRIAGLKDAPPSAAVTPDENEEQIAKSLTELCNRGREQASNTLTALHAKQKDISIGAMADAVEALNPATEINIARLLADEHDHVLSVRREERKMRRTLNYFIESNNIHHEPHYPDSYIFHWAIIVAVVVAETLLNGFFFSKGSDLGILGGVFQALTISIANVGPSLLLGVFARNFNHVQPLYRGTAGAVMFIWTGWTGFFNLLVAHYRVVLELDPFNAIINAIPHLMENTFDISNLEAWVLFIIGVVCSSFAQIKSYYADDRYPGFGKEHRRYMGSLKVYEDQKQHLRDQIRRIVDRSRDELDHLVEQARLSCNDYPVLVEQIEGLLQEYEAFENSIEDAWQGLLKIYRSNNKRVRSSPTPAYFEDFPRLCPHIALRVADKDVYQKRGDALEAELVKLVDTSKSIHASLKLINEDALSSVNDFLARIEAEADKLSDDDPMASRGSRKTKH